MTRLPPTTSRDRLARLRARLHGEDGVTLMELMVAISILAIVMVGFAAGLVNALDLAGGNRNRVIAANILDERMSELRSLDFSALATNLGSVNETISRMGLDFALTQEIQWVDEQGVDNACDSPPAAAGANQPTFLRVVLSVNWPRLAQRSEAVQSETILNPPISAYDAYDGHITVKVADRDAAPVPGTIVRVRSNATGAVRQLTTTSDGCAFFVGLDEGEYTVWLNRQGWVDRQTGLQDTSGFTPQPTYTVEPAVITPIEFSYDEQVFLDLTPRGRHGGAVPLDPSLTVANPNYGLLGFEQFANVGALRTDALYPFTGGYEVWAGECDDADPTHLEDDGSEAYPGAVRQTFLSEPDTTVSADLYLATVRVDVFSRDDGQREPRENVLVGALDSCGNGYALGLTDGDGDILLALPYGGWRFYAYAGGWRQGDNVTLTPTATGPTSASVQVP